MVQFRSTLVILRVYSVAFIGCEGVWVLPAQQPQLLRVYKAAANWSLHQTVSRVCRRRRCEVLSLLSLLISEACFILTPNCPWSEITGQYHFRESDLNAPAPDPIVFPLRFLTTTDCDYNPIWWSFFILEYLIKTVTMFSDVSRSLGWASVFLGVAVTVSALPAQKIEISGTTTALVSNRLVMFLTQRNLQLCTINFEYHIL